VADSVGVVYVKVISDSSGFKKQLQKDAATAGTDAGEHFGDKFDENLTKELKKINLQRTLGPQVDKMGKDFAKKMSTAVRNGTQIKFNLGDYISPKELARLSRQLGVPFQELSEFLSNEIPDAAKRGFDAIEREAEDAAKGAGKALKKHVNLTDLLDSKEFTDAIEDMAKRFDKIMTPAIRKSLEKGQKVDWKFHKDVRQSLNQIAKDSNATFATVEKAWDHTIRKMAANTTTVTKGGMFSRLRDQVQESSTWMDRFDSRITKVKMGLRRAGTGGFFDSLTNIMGSLIGLAGKFGKVVFKVVSKVGDGFLKLGGILTRVAGGMGKFGGVVAKIGGTFAKVGKFLKSPWGIAIAAVIAFISVGTLLTKVLGSMVTLVVDLAGMVAMLAAGIGAAVVASAIFVPIAISLAAGLGALFIAGMDAAKGVMSYQKAMNETDPKKRAAALKEYREELSKMGPATRKAVEATNDLVGSFAEFKKSMSEKLFSAGVSGLANGIKAAKPLVDALKDGLLGVSGAMGDVVDEFLRLGQSPQFMKDFNRLWEAAEVIVRNVGKALVNFFAGLTSFFAIVSPYAERFSGWILDISEKFRLWAQTDEGRNRMKSFFSDAWQLAKDLWDVLSSLTGVVLTFFRAIIDGPEGEASGGFLQSIAGWLDTLKGKIEEAEKNGS